MRILSVNLYQHHRSENEMKFGLTYFPTDISMPPGAFARAAEERSCVS